jgi:beta-lactamase superfamily II metal-dependent hydrolase
VSTVYLPDPAYIKKGAQKSNYCKDFLAGYNAIVNAANDENVKIVYLKKGSSFKVGNATLKVLWGCTYNNGKYDASYINNNSLVTKVTSGSVSFLTCGDIEKQTESQIIKSGINIKADIYKMSHHGGSTSNTAAFLKKVNPSFAFHNWVGDSPSSFGGGWVDPAINALKKTCNIYSTRYNGMLTFTVKAGHISVAGERNMVSVNANIKDSSGNIVNVVNYQFNDALEHHLTYKKGEPGALIRAELKRCADELASTDISMQTIRHMLEEERETS